MKNNIALVYLQLYVWNAQKSYDYKGQVSRFQLQKTKCVLDPEFIQPFLCSFTQKPCLFIYLVLPYIKGIVDTDLEQWFPAFKEIRVY